MFRRRLIDGIRQAFLPTWFVQVPGIEKRCPNEKGKFGRQCIGWKNGIVGPAVRVVIDFEKVGKSFQGGGHGFNGIRRAGWQAIRNEE